MKTVLAHGTFDILHAGHVRHLKRCRELGDRLIIALSSDKMAQARKGDGRPVIPFEQRKEVLEANRYVDSVLEAPYPTLNLISNLVGLITDMKPDIFVTSYEEFEASRSDFLAVGVQLFVIPEIRITSTTEIINRIVERYGETAA